MIILRLNNNFIWAQCPFISTFSAQKSHFEKSQLKNSVWLVLKATFWKKLCFILVKRTHIPNLELFKSILLKVRAHISVGVSQAITKLPFNKGCSCFQSLTHSLIPLILSLCSAQSQLPHASHLFSQHRPLRAATSLSLRISLSFLLSSVENLLHFLLLSSSSSMGIPL